MYPRLSYRGNFSLTCEIAFALLSADFGDGYQANALVGASSGLRSWKLTYSALTTYPSAASPMIELREQGRADYIWNFFCARKANGNEPFIIECPRDGKDYLVVFADHQLSFEMANWRLARTGLKLEQRRVVGVVFNADGSLGES